MPSKLEFKRSLIGWFVDKRITPEIRCVSSPGVRLGGIWYKKLEQKHTKSLLDIIVLLGNIRFDVNKHVLHKNDVSKSHIKELHWSYQNDLSMPTHLS